MSFAAAAAADCSYMIPFQSSAAGLADIWSHAKIFLRLNDFLEVV
jgi:ribosome biogenesis protein Tsr3